MYFQFLEFSRNSVNQIIRPNGTRSMLNAERDKKKKSSVYNWHETSRHEISRLILSNITVHSSLQCVSY